MPLTDLRDPAGIAAIPPPVLRTPIDPKGLVRFRLLARMAPLGTRRDRHGDFL